MQKSGYFRKTGCLAYDTDGRSHEVIELHIHGVRYAIRRADLVRAIAGRACVQVETLVHNWKYYLGAVGGLAVVAGGVGTVGQREQAQALPQQARDLEHLVPVAGRD